MKRRYLIEIILILIFQLQCDNSLISPKNESNDLLIPLALIIWSQTPNCTSGSDLWARNIETNRSECIKANLVASGKNINLYVEAGLNTKLNFDQVIDDFDNKIHNPLVETFGSPSDLNGDGKVDVFVLDIRDGSVDGGPFVAGFFDAADLFPDNPRSTVRSNQREILYMDGKQLINILDRDPLAFGSTLAHEYQHLIRFPIMQRAGVQDDVWINEGTSEVASDIGGFGPQSSRIRCLRGDSSSPCQGGGNSVSLLEWTTGPPNDSNYVLKQYAYAYAFMRYLYDNSGLTDSEKKSFFRKTVSGNDSGLRASNASNLLSLFKLYADPTTVLSSSSSDNFQILLNSFWGHVIQGSNMSNLSRSGGAASPWDISTIANAYPLGTTLDNLKTSSFPALAAIPNQIRSSSMVRVSGNQNVAVTGTTGTTRLTSIPSGAASALVFGESNKNISLTKSFPIAIADLKDLNGDNHLKGKWKTWALDHEHDSNSKQIPGGIPVCGHPFLSNQ